MGAKLLSWVAVLYTNMDVVGEVNGEAEVKEVSATLDNKTPFVLDKIVHIKPIIYIIFLFYIYTTYNYGKSVIQSCVFAFILFVQQPKLHTFVALLKTQFNPMNQTQPLHSRFWIYLTERFPLHSHGILIAAFSFSAIGYSRLCQQLPNFIDLKAFLVCIFNTVSLFFLLRVFDEHKDAEDDAKFRSELPVPRGLISLKELRNIGLTVFVFQLIISAVTFPKMLPLYAVVIAYLLLMGKEFFMADWLKKHQFWYVTTH